MRTQRRTGAAQVAPTRKLSLFRPLILSRHPSHKCLRAAAKNLPLSRYQSVIRLGSTTEVDDTIAKGGRRIEINTIDAIRNSSNKRLMKECFTRANVKTAPWRQANNVINATETGLTFGTLEGRPTTIDFPLVGKEHFGSKGHGNTLIKSLAEYNDWRTKVTLGNCIIEKFHNYGHEFRLHITADGCFYTCRKAMKQDTPDELRWRFHDDTCVWLLETNEAFHKPNSWTDIVRDCVNALNAIGADVLSFDVKVQTPVTGGIRRPYQDYILLECNSASSMDNGTGELSQCAQKYIEEIPKIITRKAQQLNR